MKSTIIALCLLLFTTCALAGDYYGRGFDEYDPASDLYFKTVLKKENRGLLVKGETIVNIAITNTATGATSLLFKEPIKGVLRTFLYETGHKDGSVSFSAEGYGAIKNNRNIEKRPLRNRLLIELALPDGKETELYVAEKEGKNLKKLVTVPIGASWHIDVKNSKLRVVHQTGTTIRLENFDW
jgi:hypothetical protein